MHTYNREPRLLPPMPGRALIPELEDIIHQETGDGLPDKSGKLLVNPKKVVCKDFPPELLPDRISNPIDVLEAAVQRAVQMMNTTIEELKRVLGQVSRFPRESPTRFFSNRVFVESLSNRMNIDVNNPGSWKGAGPGTVGLIIRWLTNMKDLLESGDLRYDCLSTHPNCKEDMANWVYVPRNDADLKAPGRPDYYHIFLCRLFWLPQLRGMSPEKMKPMVRVNMQAQVMIYAASQIYYSSLDSGLGPWVAPCMIGFVAETNGVDPIPGVVDKCK